MSAQIKVVKKDSQGAQNNVSPLGGYDTLAEQDGKRGAQDDPLALLADAQRMLNVVQDRITRAREILKAQ